MHPTLRWLIDDMSDAMNIQLSQKEETELADYLDLLFTFLAGKTSYDRSTVFGLISAFLETPGAEE